MKKNNYYLLLVFVLFASSIELFSQNDTSNISALRVQLDEIIDDNIFASSFWGVKIISLQNGQTIYERNADKLFMPASNMKLFTSSAGLLLLGSGFKYKTDIFANGKITNGTLQGDLIIVGSGDPTISGRFADDDMMKIFNDWADTLLALGIEEIAGNIIGDDNLFSDAGYGRGWAADYESEWYAAQSSALSFNDNCFDIEITPGALGAPAIINIMPMSKIPTIINNTVTVHQDSSASISYSRQKGTNIINIGGSVRENSLPRKIWVSVNNPTQFTLVTLKDALNNRGIKVNGYAADIDDESPNYDYSNASLIFTHYSVDLSEIVTVINKQSQNLYAEQLLRTIGLQYFGSGSIKNGIEACSVLYNNMNINPSDLRIMDGSGLSRQNLVKAEQIVNLLSYMYKTSEFNAFYESLPIAGVDGTLSNRMKNTPAQNRVRAKTGFVGYVSSLSGYALTADDEIFVFSLIANNFIVPVSVAQSAQDKICVLLSQFSRK